MSRAHADDDVVVVEKNGSESPPPGASRANRSVAAASRYGLLVAWACLIAVYGALRPDTFLTAGNLQATLSSQAILLVLALGLLPSLTAGELDLSAPGALGLAHVLVGYLNVVHGWPIEVTVVAVLLVGIVIGVVNASFIVFMGVDSIVVTLGMGTVLGGAALGVNLIPISGISDGLIDVARTQVMGLQLVFYYGLALTAVTWYVFSYTPLGRYLYFVGAGPSVARLSGIQVDRYRAGSLIYTSLMAAVAGVLLTGALGSADPVAGPPFLLPVFAGVFLGATTITPGRFNAWGTWIAVYFLTTGITGLELLGLSGWVDQVFYGGSLVVAAALSRLASRLAVRRS